MKTSDVPTSSKPASKCTKQQLYILGYDDQRGLDYIQPLVTDSDYKGVHFRTSFSIGAACAYLDGEIYVLGGIVEGNMSIPQQFRFDPRFGEPTFMPKMRYPRIDAGVVATPYGIAVVGGCLGGRITRSCEIFDPKTNTWEHLPALTKRRLGAQVVYVKDFGLIAINGFFRPINSNEPEELNEIEYLPLKGKRDESKNCCWQPFPQLPDISQYFAAAVHENRVFVIACVRKRLYLYMVQIYTPGFGYWQEIPLIGDHIYGNVPNSLAVYEDSLVMTSDNGNFYKLKFFHQNKRFERAQLILQYHLSGVLYPRIVVAE